MIDTFTTGFKMPKSPLSGELPPLSDYPEDSTQDAAFNEGVSALQAERDERDEGLFDAGYKLGCTEHDDAAYDTGYADAVEYYRFDRKEEVLAQDGLGGIVPEIDMFQGFGIKTWVIDDSDVMRKSETGATGDSGVVRTFETGATRDTAYGKLDYEGFLSPLVIRRYAHYMDDNRIQSDGSVRDSDNWQKGIPLESYMKSLWRHLMDAWTMHRKEWLVGEGHILETALCAIIFNASGYLHEILKDGESKCGKITNQA